MKFNEAKYNSLMETLEAREILLSQTLNHSNEFRWDSEYYWKVYLDNEVKVSSKKYQLLSELTDFVKKGIFDLPPTFYLTDGEVPLIRTTDIKSPTINFNSTVFISRETNTDNFKTILSPYDLVFTKIGAYIGDVAILPPFYSEYNFSQNVAGAKVIDKLNSPYLLAFFLSRFGKFQVLRSMMLSGQGKLELDDIRNYKIVSVTDTFKVEIKNILDVSFEKIRASELNYLDAEQRLLKDLDLFSWQPTEKNTAIKKFSNFESNGRLDAEYYQPKFDELFSHLNKVKHLQLHQLVNFKKSIEPGSEAYQTEGIPFIRVSDISKFGITQPEHHLDRAEFDIEELKPKRDTILLTKDGSVGIAYKVDKDLDVITSGALLHLTLKSDEVLPDYLTLVLNSKLTQMQAERDAGGSIIQHWRPDEIKQVVIPILPMDKQKELVKQIKNSFKLREESGQLIDKAKQAVEIAIEKNENVAIKFLS